MATLPAIFSEFEREVLRERTRRSCGVWRQNGRRLGWSATVTVHASEIRKLYRAGRQQLEIDRRLKVARNLVRARSPSNFYEEPYCTDSSNIYIRRTNKFDRLRRPTPTGRNRRCGVPVFWIPPEALRTLKPWKIEAAVKRTTTLQIERMLAVGVSGCGPDTRFHRCLFHEFRERY